MATIDAIGRIPMTLLSRVRAWLQPDSDSDAAANVARGHSKWIDLIHLLWSVWIFITPAFDHGFTWLWLWTTAMSYPLFVAIYIASFLRSKRREQWYARAVIVLGLVLIPWNSGGACTYFIFGCVMSRMCSVRMPIYATEIILWLLGFAGLARWAGYPWEVGLWVSVSTTVISGVMTVAKISAKKDAEIRLSHDEVRRLAATAERERIGRDLHDLLGHTLSLITLKLELSRRLLDLDSAAAKREMEEAERVARHALAEVRSAVTGIRAADVAAELAAARLLLESSDVRLDYGIPPVGLPPEVERGLSLVLREAATNIARHARASRAQISFVDEPQAIVLRIDDDGRGGTGEDGNGLRGMRERARALGGTLSVDSPRGQGTHVLVRVPTPVVVMLEQPQEPSWQSHGQHAT